MVVLLLKVRDQQRPTVLATVTAALAPYGVDDEGFAARLLRTGDFVVILDGANERDWGGQIRAFFTDFKNVGVLITSQVDAPDDSLTTWRLEPFSGDFARDVLGEHLGCGVDAPQVTSISAELLAELTSGYDVVLPNDLIASDVPVPNGKLELHKTTIQVASDSWHGNPPANQVFALLRKVAYEKWLASDYALCRNDPTSGNLGDDFLDHLEHTHVLSSAGDRFVFRHELMRQYLAASWLALESPSIASMGKAQSVNDRVWALGQTFQKDVFAFLCMLMGSAGDLQKLAEVAGEDIATRTVLAKSVDDIARSRGWSVQVPLGRGPTPDSSGANGDTSTRR